MTEKAQDQIRAWLLEHGKKKSWLASEVGCASGTLSVWLGGRAVPQPVYRRSLEKITGLDVGSVGAWV